MLSAMLLAFCSSSPAETADISEMYDVHVKPYKQYVHHQIYPISKIKRNTQLYSINRCLHYHTCTPYMCDECLHCRTRTIFLSDCLRNSLRELKKNLQPWVRDTRPVIVGQHCRPTMTFDNVVRQCRSTKYRQNDDRQGRVSGVLTLMTHRVSRPLVLSNVLVIVLITWWHAFGTLLWSVELSATSRRYNQRT